MPVRLPFRALLRAVPALLSTDTLLGCGGAVTVPNSEPLQSSSNWQIQLGSSITWPATGSYMSGALQTMGTRVTGTFTNSLACTPSVSSYTGTVDSAGNLTLDADFVKTSFRLATNPYTPSTGAITAGGYLCQVLLSGPAVGVEIAALNGTRAGAVTSTTVAPIAAGNVSLAIAQSTTPNASGQFPLTGTLIFTASGCTLTTPVTGLISGEGITLATASGSPAGTTNVTVAASTIPTAAQVNASTFSFYGR